MVAVSLSAHVQTLVVQSVLSGPETLARSRLQMLEHHK
jgi:hypothetical protein